MATETVMQQQQQQGDHHAQSPPSQQQKQPANPLKSQISKDLRAKANNFLNSKQYANNLLEIIAHLAQNAAQNESITAVVLTLEVIFTELLKRKDMIVKDDAVEGEEATPESEHSVWLLQHYEETWSLLMKCVEHEKTHEAQQALVTAMKLLIAESKYPLAGLKPNKIPEHRMRSILQSMLSGTKSTLPVIQRFKEYSEYLDVQACCWRLFEQIPTRLDFQNEIYALNFLELLNALPVTNEIQEQGKMLCNSENAIEEKAYKKAQSYLKTRKSINKVWDLVMLWCDGSKEAVHKQTLILLLERIMPHLEKPVLLTDFLMDSLDCGGAISLLALQGVFTLIQKHNITYPNIYEKLYSMFEPEIFHTKFKARLFYLADIFLSSTHLPESLVGAFAKRLARLSLVAPPQDAIIIMYFIGNLILRHNGLKRLICSKVPAKLNSDPYIMEEREPTKSCAMESSLWEIICLQKHAVPSVALAARFISQPLPNKEWDLSSVLEIKEDDIFDQEISRKSKQYAMAFEKPHGLYLAKNDKFKQHWNLF